MKINKYSAIPLVPHISGCFLTTSGFIHGNLCVQWSTEIVERAGLMSHGFNKALINTQTSKSPNHETDRFETSFIACWYKNQQETSQSSLTWVQSNKSSYAKPWLRVWSASGLKKLLTFASKRNQRLVSKHLHCEDLTFFLDCQHTWSITTSKESGPAVVLWCFQIHLCSTGSNKTNNSTKNLSCG